jgi:periplasmic protein TonB
MTIAEGGAWAGGDRVASPVSVPPHHPHKLAKRSRDWRPHPLRSLASSAGCHVLMALILMCIPAGTSQRGSRQPSTRWTSVVLTVSPPAAAVEWDESVEVVDQLAAMEPLVELPEEFAEPQRPRDTFFDEPLRDEGPREPLTPADAAFEELPEDLFTPPVEEVAEPEAVPEPTPVAPEPVETPPNDPAPAEPEPLPPPVEEPTPPDDAPPAESESEPTPETEGTTDDAETSGDGEAESPLLEAPAPRYPASARAQGKQGTVWLAVDVDARGRVVQVQIKTSSGHRVLDETARQVVLERWKFKPRTDGESDVRRFLEPVTFKLRAR